MRLISIITLLFTIAGCSSWSTINVTNVDAGEESGSPTTGETVDPASILITEGDIPDRKYKILADIEVTVNKTSIFNKDPTPEMVEEKLRSKAAELGADAVILVRYGNVGISLSSWGALNGKGRAIVFIE